VILDFDIDDWLDVGIRRGRLEVFVSPKLLKQASGD
jgi:phosphohistidine phosphatase